MKTESSRYLLDTSAWIEFFEGSSRGKKVKEIIESNATIITASPCISELAYWSFTKGHDFHSLINLLRKHSRIVDTNTNHWVEAAHKKAKLRPKKKAITLYDTVLLSVQEMTDSTVVTTDNDFRGLPNTIML